MRQCLGADLWGPKQRHIWWGCTLALLSGYSRTICVAVFQLITTITVSTCLTSSLHIYSLRLFFRLPCSLVDQHLCRRLLAGKDSWSELYRHVVCVHMNRTPTGTFHSHNFDTVVTCLLRDTSKLLVCICWSYIWLLCDIWLFLSVSAEVFRRYCRMFVM